LSSNVGSVSGCSFLIAVQCWQCFWLFILDCRPMLAVFLVVHSWLSSNVGSVSGCSPTDGNRLKTFVVIGNDCIVEHKSNCRMIDSKKDIICILPGEKSHWQTLWYNLASRSPPHERGSKSQL
jgi:hypothetical protein